MPELARLLVLLGAVQGMVLAPVLWLRRANRLANRVLGVLVAAVAAMMLLGLVGARWGFAGHPHLLGLGAPLPFLFGPLLWLYVVALTRPVERFDARWLAHTLPFLAILLFFALTFYFQPPETKLALARASDTGTGSPALHVFGLLGAAQAFVYVALAWRELERYGAKMRAWYSDLYRVDLRWLRALLGVNAIVWTLVLAVAVLRMVFRGPAFVGGAVQLASALAIFVTGYIGLWQPELAQKAAAATLPAPPPPKYQRNRLDDEEAKALVAKLESLMTNDRLHENAGLTLPMLADALGVPPHTASQLLNVHVGRSFFVYVNGHRVDALKRALSDPANAGRGVLDLAYAVGFSSKSTVNSFFKKLTGTTPTAFREEALASVAKKSSTKSAG